MSSDSVVKQLSARAVRGENPVDLSFIGAKVCFAPEGSFAAKSYAGMFFPESDATGISSDIPSEGVWFLYYERDNTVQLVTVAQTELLWPSDESQVTGDVAGCGKLATITVGGSVHTIKPKIETTLREIRGQ